MMHQFPCNEEKARSRRGWGRGLLTMAAMVASLAVLCCRETSLEILRPPSKVIPAKGSGGAAGGSPGPECTNLASVDQPCSSASECCSGLCALDSLSTSTCRPTPGCLGLAQACSLAGQCCSLSCEVSDGGPGACGDGVSRLCAIVSNECQENADCCSGLCSAGLCAPLGPPPPPGPPACSPAGEACNAPADCCAQVCNPSTDEANPNRCALLPGCREQGELCLTAADCCDSVCSPDKSGVLRCASLGPCPTADTRPCDRQVGDVCKNSNECCSRACVATTDGISRCAPAPGCRPGCDLCTQNSDCCSNSCQVNPAGIGRCAVPTGLLPEGEVCNTDAQCSQDLGVTQCVEDPTGLTAKRCRLNGPAFLDDGAACSLASLCKGGHCLPASEGGYACSSTCVQENQPCTARADCCVVPSDCLSVAGQRVCRETIH
jgi:hypothetical protein